MFGRVHVPRKTERMRPAGQQFEQRAPIGGAVCGFGIAMVRHERNVHRHDDQMLARHMLQKVAHKLQLRVAEFSGIAAVAAIPPAASIVNVVEQDEGRLAVLEGIVAWTKEALPRFARVMIAGGVPVQIVVARAVMDKDEIKQNLIDQLTGAVRWTQSVQSMIADGASKFTESGPGKVLQGLILKIEKSMEVSGVS